MNLAGIRAEIEPTIAAAWAISQPAVPLIWDNLAFTPPADDAWVSVGIQVTDNPVVGFGSGVCREYLGFVTFAIRCPLRNGAAESDGLSDAVIAIFASAISDVKYEDIRISTVGESEGWYLVNIFVDFTVNG